MRCGTEAGRCLDRALSGSKELECDQLFGEQPLTAEQLPNGAPWPGGRPQWERC